MDEERLAEIDRQIEALGQPETPADVILAELGALSLDEADAILEELAEGRDIEVELAPLPRVTTSVSEPPTGVSAAPPMVDEHEEEFDLPPPSRAPDPMDEDEEDEENLLGSGLEELGKSDIPEPLSASLAAWIDPPDSEAPSEAPEAFADLPPNPKLPELGDFEEDEGERTGLFTQEDIEAIRASQPPPPRSAPPPPASMVPPPPGGPRPVPTAPPPPIPVSVAPPSDDEELEILDDDDFELMIEEDGLDAVDEAMDDVIDELIDDSIDAPVDSEALDSFDDSTEANEDEPVIREPEVDQPSAAADAEAEAEAAAEAAAEGEEEGEGEDGEKKGFFKKLFG